MKIVMVNDCAFVGETLLKYMPPTVEKQHIKRTRGVWSKTFGVAYKILRAKGDVYHANYLLQDCYITTRLGKKPLIGYALGSDLRSSLKHALWGRVVRHNLKNCDKVLVSTPDVLGTARQFRDDAEYMPPPVDPELFYPKPPDQPCDRKRVLIAGNANWKVKGTDMAIRALSKNKNEFDVSIVASGSDLERSKNLATSLGLHVSILPKASHEKINEYYWNAGIVMDQFRLGSPGMVTLEAIACGRPVITYVSSEFPEYADFPLKDINTEEKVEQALAEADVDLWKREQDYLVKNHKIDTVSDRLLKIYSSLIER